MFKYACSKNNGLYSMNAEDPKLCCIGNILTKLVHPLTRKSDWLLISLYSITPESHVKFMRIKEMINNLRSS